MKYFFSICLTAAAIMSFCLWYFPRPLLVIGSHEIYENDVEQRKEILKIYSIDSNLNLATEQLKKSANYIGVLEKLGLSVADSELEKESNRIDQNTKDIEKLNKIKALFKADKKAYYKNFILPVLAEKKLHLEYINKKEEMNLHSKKTATDFIELCSKNPALFEEKAKELGFNQAKLLVSEKIGIVWEGSPEFLNQAGLRSRAKVKGFKKINLGVWTFVNQLKEKGVFGSPIEEPERWLVVNYLGKDKDGINSLQVVFIPKLSFESWYQDSIK